MDILHIVLKKKDISKKTYLKNNLKKSKTKNLLGNKKQTKENKA